MDEQGLADHIANDPRDDLDRMVRRAKLKEPRSRAAWTGQLEVITGQPDHEDLGLDRTLDVEAVRVSRHDAMVRREPGGKTLGRSDSLAPYGLQPGH